jgi:hypothetical protein
MNKIELEKVLKSGVVELKFTKVDGSIREMRATRKLDLIGEEHTPKKDSTPLETTLRVFDLDAKGWRSFRVENLIEIKYES